MGPRSTITSQDACLATMRPVRAARRSSKHMAVLAVLAVFAGEDSVL
jgi:hypothetical protein